MKAILMILLSFGIIGLIGCAKDKNPSDTSSNTASAITTSDFNVTPTITI